jgi:hypothetical protein
MSDGSNESDHSRPSVPFDPLDPGITDVYADDAYISIGNTNVSLIFTTTLAAANRVKPSVRVFLSHGDFVNLMKIWETRRDLLAKAYDGAPMTLREMDNEKVSRLFEEMNQEL